MITAKILTDSVNPDGQRLTTYLLKYPRFVHSEIMTHRAFSRNAASSRAIPIQKIIEQVKNDPAMPVRWGKNGPGMQDHGAFEGEHVAKCIDAWVAAAEEAVKSAERLIKNNLHKQIVNRVLEPFMWMETLVSATEWQNFFALRVHKDAQPEFQRLAYLMLVEYVENSTPVWKNWGEWHIPYGDRMPDGLSDKEKMKVATARAARTSYLTMDGQIDVEKDIGLHDRLADGGHWSPFEHTAQAIKDWNEGNFRGWKQYRYFFPNQNRQVDLKELLDNYRTEINNG